VANRLWLDRDQACEFAGVGDAEFKAAENDGVNDRYLTRKTQKGRRVYEAGSVVEVFDVTIQGALRVLGFDVEASDTIILAVPTGERVIVAGLQAPPPVAVVPQ